MLLAAPLLFNSFTYQFDVNAPLFYALRVKFDGMIPILGGNEGTADVQLKFQVRGLEPKAGRARAENELTEAVLLFNDARLPLSLENVQDFFPKTEIEYNAFGKILSNSAPDITLPVRLPGLDIKRFPDISYLPIEFPSTPLEVGSNWKFTKPFGGSDVQYDCTLTRLDAERAVVKVTVNQTYTVLEDAGMQVVANKQDAENEVTTTMKASGEFVFSVPGKHVLRSVITGTADSVVKPIEKGEPTQRKLNIDVRLHKLLPDGTIAPEAQTESDKPPR